MSFWAYMLHCRGGYFYTGHTDDLEQRIAAHRSGAIKGFASDHLPVELVWSQEFPTRLEAIEAERRIKGWSRAKKLALVRGDWGEISRLGKVKGSPSTSSGRTDWVLIPKVLEGAPSAIGLTASVRRSGRVLIFTYEMSGEVDKLSIPPEAAAQHTDDLWQSTCFEAFLGSGDTSYLELNFSPSGAWAIYAFDSYRAGQRALALDKPPGIRFDGATLIAEVVLLAPQGAALGLSAMIEHKDSTKSYWALAHPSDKPDFHHPDCFIAQLP